MAETVDPNYEAVADLIKTLEGKQPLGMVQIGGEGDWTNEQVRRAMYVVTALKPCIRCGMEPRPDHAVNFWKIPSQLATLKEVGIFFNACIVCRLSLGFFTWVAATLTSRLEARLETTTHIPMS